MIVNAAFREPGHLAQHLQRVDTNERVVIRADLSQSCSLNVDDAIADFAALGLARGVANPIIHISVSPELPLTSAQEEAMIDRVRAVYGVPDDHPVLVIEHEKPGETNRPSHYHLALPHSKIDGTLIKDSFFKIKNERASIELEYDFGHPLIPGPNIGAVRDYLRERRPEMATAIESLEPPPRENASTTVSDKNYAFECGIDLRSFDANVLNAWQSDAFVDSVRLARFGLTLAAGDTAVMIVDATTGFAQSLQRVLNRQSKRLGEPLNFKKRDIQTALRAGWSLRPLPDVRREQIARSLVASETMLAEAVVTDEHIKGALFKPAKSDADFGPQLSPPGMSLTTDESALSSKKKKRKTSARQTIKQDVETIKHRHREIIANRKRTADLAWRSARIWRSKDLKSFVFWAGTGAAAVCGAGLLLSIAAGALGAKLVVDRGRQKLKEAKDASTAVTLSRQDIRLELDRYFAGLKAAKNFELAEIPKHAAVAAGHIFTEMSMGGAPRMDVVETLENICAGLPEKIAAVAKHSTSSKLRNILRSMCPADASRAEAELRNFVSRKGAPPRSPNSRRKGRTQGRGREIDGHEL